MKIDTMKMDQLEGDAGLSAPTISIEADPQTFAAVPNAST